MNKEKKNGIDVFDWQVENKQFWESTGKSIANRNLWISIPSLLCGFAVWLYWSIITVQMLNLGFPFAKSELFTLMAIAGLAGATLRIPSTFFVRPCGGRNTIFFTTGLLIIPALGTGLALQNVDTPLWVFQILALFSGLGGGNFASSMSNISFFFPKKVQGASLGLNAGLGNFGVTTMQILVPLVMTMGVFGGPSRTLVKSSGSLIGKIAAGNISYIQNAGFIWVPFLVILVILGFFKMNNIRTENVSPHADSTAKAILIMTGLLGIGFLISCLGLWPILTFAKVGWVKWVVLPMVIVLTVFLMKQIPGGIKSTLNRQYKIFEHKQTWVMTIIYTMTFGSFIGYSAAFPLSIKVVFGFKHTLIDGVWDHSVLNPNGPSALAFAWIGPFIGALIRPVGGWIADKLGGAKVTHYVSMVMVASALGVSYFMNAAYQSSTPEEFFWPFFILFIVLFTATGVGNGSTFRTIAQIFNEEQAGPVLGWTSAVAAYGAFLIPIIFGEQIKAATPQYALYGFAIFYAICLFLNWWEYLGPKRAFDNP